MCGSTQADCCGSQTGDWNEDWADMTSTVQSLWITLGYDENSWDDSDGWSVIHGKTWDSVLTSEQQEAAAKLCFTEESWNAKATRILRFSFNLLSKHNLTDFSLDFRLTIW